MTAMATTRQRRARANVCGWATGAWRTALATLATLVMIVAFAACRTAAGGTGDRDVERLVALGRLVFFNPALSADGRVSCATCHRPERAYSDGLPRASGTFGQRGTRNAPSLLDVGRQQSLFWDGRRTRLEALTGDAPATTASDSV